jgi:hypothetical protein
MTKLEIRNSNHCSNSKCSNDRIVKGRENDPRTFRAFEHSNIGALIRISSFEFRHSGFSPLHPAANTIDMITPNPNAISL